MGVCVCVSVGQWVGGSVHISYSVLLVLLTISRGASTRSVLKFCSLVCK